MADDDIIQKISLEGSDEIRKQLEELGDDGAAAIKKLEEAGGGDLAAGVKAMLPQIKAANDEFEKSNETVGKLPAIFSKVSSAIKSLTGALGFGDKFTKDAEKAGKSASGLGTAVRDVARQFQILGRATDIPGLQKLGGTFSLISRNIGLVAFPAFIAGMAGIAASAANAQSHILDVAASIQQTPAAFNRAASVVTALGGSVDDAGKTFGTFEKNIDAGLASVNAAADNVAKAGDAVDQAESGFVDATKALAPLRVESTKLSSALANGTISMGQYNSQQANLRAKAEEAGQAILKAGDALEKAQKQLLAAKRATTPLEDAFRSVGITLSESFKKLPIDEQLKRIAPGFANLGKDVDRTKLAVQLLGDEMGRKFVDALSGGAAGLAAFQAEGQRIRPTLDGQAKSADEFVRTLGKLGEALGSLKDAFGSALTPVFIKFFNDMINVIVENRTAIADFGKVVATVLSPFLEGVVVVFKAVIATANLLLPLFDSIAKKINDFFGSNVSGGQIFLAIILGLVAALAPIIPLILLAAAATAQFVSWITKIDFSGLQKNASAIWAAIKGGFGRLWDDIVALFNGGINIIKAVWGGVVQFFQDIWNGIVAGAQGLWGLISTAFSDGVQFIKDAFGGAIQYVKDRFNDFITFLSGWVDAGKAFIQGLIDKIKELLGSILGLNSASASANSGDSAGLGHHATGGEIWGRGTSTSDSILARLSNGEFVVKAAAVRKYGTQALHAINSMQMPKLPGFNMGGLVDALAPMRSIPRFAEGGSVTAASRTGFTLQIGAETFAGLSAPTDTANRMVKFATVKAVRRAGVRPSWYGNNGK